MKIAFKIRILSLLLLSMPYQSIPLGFDFTIFSKPVLPLFERTKNYIFQHPKTALVGLVGSSVALGFGAYKLFQKYYKKSPKEVVSHSESAVLATMLTRLQRESRDPRTVHQLTIVAPVPNASVINDVILCPAVTTEIPQVIGQPTTVDPIPTIDPRARTNEPNLSRPASTDSVPSSDEDSISTSDNSDDEDHEPRIRYEDFLHKNLQQLKTFSTSKLSPIYGINHIDCWLDGKYIHLRTPNFMVDNYSHCSIKEYHNTICKPYATQEYLANLRKNVVGNYKIHMMPQSPEDLMQIIEFIIHEVKNNPEFAKKMYQIKFLDNLDFNRSMYEQLTTDLFSQEVFPILVIYPALGKDNAQYVLNTLYNRFKDMPGLNIPPRFNIQVAGPIYYGHTDGDLKENFQDYYNDDKTLLRADFEGGADQDYRLGLS